MGCIFSRPDSSSAFPEQASVHNKLQGGQVKTGNSSGKQTTATTAESTVARVINIGASSTTKATASDSLATASKPSEQGKAAVSAQPQEGSKAEEQKQKRAPPVVSGDEVDFVFSTIKTLLGSPQDTVDVQTLKVPTRHEAEVKLAQWSELGKVVVDWTTPLVAMLPFGPPMSSVIGGIYNRAAQAAINSANCAQLLELVQQCDRQLAKLYRGVQEQQGGLRVPDDAAQGMRTMAELLVEAGHVMVSYSRHGFLMRAIMSNIHKAEFESLDADIRAAMQETCFAMTVELVITQGTYTDEMAAFRAAVCTAAGLPESAAEQAVKTLQQSKPELLLRLLKQHGSFADQVIVSELERIRADMNGMKSDIADVKSQIAQLQESQDKAVARGPVALPKYLQTWWKDTVGRLIGRVANNVFLAHLVNWFKQKGLEESLAEYDETLRKEGELPLPLDQEHVYLYCVVMPLMDKDEDGYVTRSELNYLHQLGIEYARTVALGLPEGLPELLDALFLCLQLYINASGSPTKCCADTGTCEHPAAADSLDQTTVCVSNGLGADLTQCSTSGAPCGRALSCLPLRPDCMDSPGANCLGTTRCALADAVGCSGVPSGLVCVLHRPVEAAVPLFSVCSSGPLQLASSPPPSPPTPSPSPPPPSAALPARGFPFCLCNRSAAHTPFTWSVQSEATLDQVTRIVGTIRVRNCSAAANPCCRMDLHKVEFLVGDGCQRSVAATFVNGRQVSWSFHSHGIGQLSFKLTNLGLSTATAAGVQLQVHLLQASTCGTAATFFKGRSLAFFNAAQTCCPAFSLSLP